MTLRSFRFLWSAPLLAVVACTYAPADPAEEARPTYRSDLAACQQSASQEAHRRVVSLGELFLTYPISYPILKRRELRKCMDGKGYHSG
jgi:hypothetical protein